MEKIVKSTQNIGESLHNVFKTVVKDVSQDLPPLGESGLEVSNFIPEPRNKSEATTFLYDVKP